MLKLVCSRTRALKYALEGLWSTFQTEQAFRVEVVLSVILTPVVFILHFSALERAALLFSLVVVLATELLNTGLEVAIDRISIEWHPLSKKAKDAGAAAVLCVLLGTLAVWVLIFLHHFRGS